MSAFFNRVQIIGDIRHGTRIYLDGMELKGCTDAKLELSVNDVPMLSVKMRLDKFDVDLSQFGQVRNVGED